MLCERCKIREANILYTEIIDGHKREHHFCTHCAKELDFGQYSSIFDLDFPLGKLLTGLLAKEDRSNIPQGYAKIICPTCKTSYEEFINQSSFGCKDCYEVFDLLISDNIKQLQGSDEHKGKVPKSFSVGEHTEDAPEMQSAAEAVLPLSPGTEGETTAPSEGEDIATLRRRLSEAIAAQEFEQAAIYRDAIREKLKEDHGDVV